MKKNYVNYIGLTALLVFVIFIGFFIATLNNSDVDGICPPKIGCIDNTLVYQTISCGLLVNTNSDESVI
jgi:hypothetical protein